MTPTRPAPSAFAPGALLLLALAALPGPAQAQFKVVGPDGKITYTEIQ